MEMEGNRVKITARNKDVSFRLLRAYNFEYEDFGNGSIGKGAFGKLLYLIWTFFKFLFLFQKNKPNIALSFGSVPLAFVSYLYRVPHISFDDTEHAKLNKILYVPFTPLVITPSCFYNDLGSNHFRFKGYMELFYLHKNRFKPKKSVLEKLNILEGEIFTLFRFVSWEAFHDIGQKGINLKERIELVNEARKYGKVFISAEGKCPDELKEYEINIPPENLHDVLYFAKLYIGEGGTTASECAMLGTPSIYINTLPLMGYLKDAERFELLYHLFEMEEIKLKMKNIYSAQSNYYMNQKEKLLKDVIDPTSFLTWLVNNYPESKINLMKNQNDQGEF